MATPYKTDDQIKKEYANAYAQYQKTQSGLANRQKASKNAEYDNTQKQNYVAYMQNQKELPEQLAQSGITGGGTETSALRARTNYENNYNNTERQRNTDTTSIDNALRDTLNTYKMTADENMRTELANERQKRIQHEQQLQEQAENRYSKTISGWDSISGIDREISNINKSGKDTWRIAYLRARRAELVAQAKEEAAAAAASSGGGSSSRSYSSSGGGGSSSGSTSGTPTTNAVAAAGTGALDRVYAKNAINLAKSLIGGGSKKSSSSRTSGIKRIIHRK